MSSDVSPFEHAALLYLEAGWYGVLPLPAGQKKTPPDGYTGATGDDPTSETIEKWRRAPKTANGNVALRMPKNVLGIDVDQYGDKHGARTLAECEEKWGELPAGPMSSSRGPGPSGIRFFWVPAGLKWPSVLPGGDVELIRRGHRYAVAWPSVVEGREYRWYEPNESGLVPTDAVPEPLDLPELPAEWIAGLTGGETAGPAAERRTVDSSAFFESLRPGPACTKVSAALAYFEAAEGSRHDSALSTAGRLVSLGAKGHAGVVDALALAEKGFRDAVHGDRTEDEAEAEWSRMIDGAVSKFGDSPTKVCRCEWGALGPYLPEEFWAARPILGHIRQAAHSRGRSGDLVLGGILARMSSMVSPRLRLKTVIGPGSLNVFTIGVGSSGAGKSTSNGITSELLPAPGYLGGDFPDGIGLGSGEGLAEIYWGMRPQETGETYKSGDRKGEPKTTLGRARVRENAFFVVDEGEVLNRMHERSGTTIGLALRSAWFGATIGQSNARSDTTRVVTAGSYSLGLVMAIQRTIAQAILSESEIGTPQRFLWMMTGGPDIPDDWPDWPGPLPVRLTRDTGDEFAGPGGDGPLEGDITYADEINSELRAETIRRSKGGDVDPFEAHRPLMLAKVSALFALLDGRMTVNEDDWALATTIFEVSNIVLRDLVEFGENEAQKSASARSERQIEHAVKMYHALDQVDKKTEIVAIAAANVVAKVGEPMTVAAVRRKLKSTHRPHIEPAIDAAIAVGWLVRDGELLKPGLSRPAEGTAK